VSSHRVGGLREVYDGPIGVHARNTEARFGITALPDYYHIAPGWDRHIQG